MTSGDAEGSRPATEWMAVTSRDSSIVKAGMMPGKRSASRVFPHPGGPVISRL